MDVASDTLAGASADTSGDASAILDSLNKAQREAVTAPAGHALVLAGAGSGKTRVLTRRIAWLCGVERVSPYAIVAVTFTNKAANEMRARVEALLGMPAQGFWIGTFHGLCHRFLRLHRREAGLAQSFQVIDAEDQRRLIKRVTVGLNIDPGAWPIKESQWFINARKDEGARPGDVQAGDFASRQLLRIYEAYEENCKRAGLVDFTELLLRTTELLRDNRDLQRRYHERFRCILVDEFQDTNALQYAWMRLLAGPETPVFAVGDDDQSIYGWRGARIENIRDFGKHFPNVTVYRLERNYRSTSTILSAANALIENNRGRLGKNLWTDRKGGELILLFEAVNEREEAQFAVNAVESWINRGHSGSDAAVLYRSNAQSRAIEEALIARGVPYRVYGGLRFFERAVVKDALAYLRIAANPEDDQSYERVVNTPPRGIGERTLEKIRDSARAKGGGLWGAGERLLKEQSLAARTSEALARFHEAVNEIKRSAAPGLRETAERAVVVSGLLDHHRRRNDEKSLSAVENLEEFVAAAGEFEQNWVAEEGVTTLDAFLTQTALEAGERQTASDEKCVQLMTLHAAKGLEFPLVLMVGMEEGLFPHASSLENVERLEEERRLCYVGVTRAREQLIMSWAAVRRRYKETTPNRVSRFVGEIPPELIEEVRPRAHTRIHARVHAQAPRGGPGGHDNQAEIAIGSSVEHRKFGKGVVLDREGSGLSARAQVRFENSGVKWLVLAYANLKILESRPH